MHDKNDLSSFRCNIAQFVSVDLCTRTKICRTLHLTYSYVKRCCRLYESHGESAFWNKDNRHGHAYKVTPEMLRRIQQMLDKGEKGLSIAKRKSESHIRYYIGKGDLKKRLLVK